MNAHSTRIQKSFRAFKDKIKQQNTKDLSWCLKNSELFYPGYLHVNRLGKTRFQRFLNRYASFIVPGIWKALSKQVIRKIYRCYGSKFEAEKQGFNIFIEALSNFLKANGREVYTWSFSQLASFLEGCVNDYIELSSMNNDLFKDDKHIQKEYVLPLYRELRLALKEKRLPLSTLCYLVTKANNIDSYEANGTDFAKQFYLEVNECIDNEEWLEEFITSQLFFDYRALHYDCETEAKTILYEADNQGELYIDLLLIEYFLDKGHRVVLSTKSGPVLNDVTFTDIKEAFKGDELSHFAAYIKNKQFTVIHNGSRDVIKSLYELSDDFKKAYDLADIVISKGQGHFESFPHISTLTSKRQALQYKKAHYHLFVVKSFVIQQSLELAHGREFKQGELYCYCWDS